MKKILFISLLFINLPAFAQSFLRMTCTGVPYNDFSGHVKAGRVFIGLSDTTVLSYLGLPSQVVINQEQRLVTWARSEQSNFKNTACELEGIFVPYNEKLILINIHQKDIERLCITFNEVASRAEEALQNNDEYETRKATADKARQSIPTH